MPSRPSTASIAASYPAPISKPDKSQTMPARALKKKRVRSMPSSEAEVEQMDEDDDEE